MFQFGHFEQFKSKQADLLQRSFHRKKENEKKMKRKPNWKGLAAEATTLPGLQVNFHASVALHTISSQVYPATNNNLHQPGH